MKRLVATALVALMLASCQEAPKGYVINGEVTGRTEGKVYLKSFRNKMFFDVDTAELKEGKFTFKGELRTVIVSPSLLILTSIFVFSTKN